MADDKFVKSFLILFFLGCVVRNGFCAPIEDEVVLNDGTVLKRVIQEAVKAPPPRIDNALDANKKDENNPVIVVLEVQSAPPPRIMSKRDADDGDAEDGDAEDGDSEVVDDGVKTNEPNISPTAPNESDQVLLKTNTPSIVANGAQPTTVSAVQKQNSDGDGRNSEKSEMKSSESPKSVSQGNVNGQSVDDADDDAGEDKDSQKQKSTVQTALPTRPSISEDGGKADGSEDGDGNQGDTKEDVDDKENDTVRNGSDDGSDKNDDKPSAPPKTNNEPSDNSVGNTQSPSDSDDKPPGEDGYDDGTIIDEGSEDPPETADKNDKINIAEGDDDLDDGEEEEEEEDSSNNRITNERPVLEDDAEEGAVDDGEPSEMDRSSVVKKNNFSESPSSGHFMSYFLIAVVFVACFYLVFHNRQKIKAYVLEGRNGRGRRRKAGDSEYRQLSTAEEVLPSADKEIESKTTYAY